MRGSGHRREVHYVEVYEEQGSEQTGQPPDWNDARGSKLGPIETGGRRLMFWVVSIATAVSAVAAIAMLIRM